MLIGVVGKTNVGKTTFFSAATLVDAEISSRVFTTIEPNKGVSYARVKCVCRGLGLECKPQDGFCASGFRYVPVKLVDIAGLVPDAHKGRGLGNRFLSDIMEADALLHVVDASGSTDSDGNIVAPGSNDPREDIAFLEREIDYWILGILKRNIKGASDFAKHAAKQLSGLKISEAVVEESAKHLDVNAGADDAALLRFVRAVREAGKPMVIAANKIDVPGARIDIGVPASAESELALRRAARSGAIAYNPGDAGFEIIGALTEKQRAALDFIRSQVLARFGSTGVQSAINKAVFEALGMIVVYPVENEHKFSDTKGNVLPNALLLRKGSTPRDLAYRVHADIGDSFAAAVNARTKQRVAADYELRDGDIISVKTR